MTLHIVSIVRGRFNVVAYYTYGTYNAIHFSGYIPVEQAERIAKANHAIPLVRTIEDGLTETLYRWAVK